MMIKNDELSIVQKIKLSEYLRTQQEYSEKEVDQAVAAVNRMNPELRKQLVEFLVTGEYPSTVIEKVTVKDLVDKLNMNPVTAFLSLDYLMEKPDEAKYILSRKPEKIEIDQEFLEELLASQKDESAGGAGE